MNDDDSIRDNQSIPIVLSVSEEKKNQLDGKTL